VLLAIRRAGLVLLCLLAAGRPVEAQDTDSAEVARLKAQVEAILTELEAMRLGQDVVAQADTSVHGFGPAASKVYKHKSGVSIGGYGEFHYQNFNSERQDDAPSGLGDQIDALRAIVYVWYKFSDRILFNSEVEFEHGSTEDGGSVSVEFAYLEGRLSPAFGIRGGLLLAPMGFLNEIHEPPTFLGTTRPETERRIIPSTWREVGAGVFGSRGPVSYRAYLLTGFDATGFTAGGIRDGRQNGAEAKGTSFGLVGRVDWAGMPGLTLGASAYIGNAGQGATLASDPTETIGARTTIWDAHAEYKARGLDLRGLFAQTYVSDAEQVNELNGLVGDASVGSRLTGWYLQAGYDVLHSLGTSQQLLPYVRYETFNTQDDVPDAFAANPANDRTIISIGAAWKPLFNIALKADYQIQRNDADTGVNQFNVNLGYLF
jgi:hypothetical protein